MDLELARGRPGGGLGQPRSDLLANPGQQVQQPALKGRREELDPLETLLPSPAAGSSPVSTAWLAQTARTYASPHTSASDRETGWKGQRAEGPVRLVKGSVMFRCLMSDSRWPPRQHCFLAPKLPPRLGFSIIEHLLQGQETPIFWPHEHCR